MTQAFRFRLHIQSTNDSWIFDIPVTSKPIIIGRQPGIDLLLEHQQISRRHAALHCAATECQIADLGSANGTRLNGQKLTPQVPVPLKPGDSIQIGGFNLDFEQVPIEEADEVKPAEEPGAPSENVVALQDEPEAPPPPPPDFSPAPSKPRFDPSRPPPGLTFRSDRLLGYLPPIYHSEFMARFLAIFESVLFPIEWQIDNFDLFLDPETAPKDFLPWLANWFELTFDSTWSEAQQRTFLKEAYSIYSRAGTRAGLSRVLEIYCGQAPEIDDQSEDLLPHTFRVKLKGASAVERKSVERLINAYKPAHATYTLEIA
jgi:phage tail-like protein